MQLLKNNSFRVFFVLLLCAQVKPSSPKLFVFLINSDIHSV